MLKTHKKTLFLTSLVILLPIVVGLYLWPQLPDSMATHFSWNNQANGYSSKPFAILFLPLFLLATQWLIAVFIAHDPKNKNIHSFIYTLILWIVPIISICIGISLYAFNLGYQLPMETISEVLLGFLFLVIGAFLPKTKQNHTVGIRLPWTLNNEENWNQTHRVSGIVWMMGGLLLLILALIEKNNLYFMITILFVLILVPCLYSFWLHIHDHL